MDSFWYLATPYSKYTYGLNEAAKEAAIQASVLLKAGIPVFSPIAHTHPIAIFGKMGTDIGAWKWLDTYMIRSAQGIIVCEMQGWEESAGIEEEIKMATKLNKLIIHMAPNKVPAYFGTTWTRWLEKLI